MKIRSMRKILGPNVFHNKPVVVMTIDLEDRAECSSDSIPGFTDRLLALLPGLEEHTCSPGYRGGFVERLRRGTYFAHIIEHVALELSGPAGIPVTYGKSVYGGEPGVYQVIVRAKSPAGMEELLRIAVDLVEAVAKSEAFTLDARLEEAKREIASEALGPSTRAIVNAAVARGIPYFRLNDASLIQLGFGKHRKVIEAALSNETSAVALGIARDKSLTKQLLADAFLPVPKGSVVRTEEDAIAAATAINGPAVLKPLDANHGRGVSVGVSGAANVAAAFNIARAYARSVIVEERLLGRDYRVLVVGGKMVAAAERIPAHVVGDGVSTIAQLVERENQNPLRGEGHGKPLSCFEIDTETLSCLERVGLTTESVPALGRMVIMKQTANISAGGTAKDVTDSVHPEVRVACERAAQTIGLNIAGIDLMVADISRPIPATGGGIIEVNAGPGLRMHAHPTEGASRDVGAAIVDMLYPPGTAARIPVISITGTNGKTTVTKLIGSLMSHTKKRVGMTCTDGIYIDGNRVAKGDTTGPASARCVLTDSTVDVAVLETARGGIIRRGLGYDWSDVGVITNIQADHIGQDGIQTLDDIENIKIVVAERVREGGTLVLNADDPRLAKLPDHPRIRGLRRRVSYFSLDAENEVIRSHRAAGGTAYFVRGTQLVEARGPIETVLADVKDIPFTYGGTAAFQVANCLAAAAACRAVYASVEELTSGLSNFEADRDNIGRANVFRVGRGYAVLDYGHNPEAFQAIAAMARQWTRGKVTGIVCPPGDRNDQIIRHCGKVLANGFDKIIIREDYDLRGRQPGELPRLLGAAVREAVPHREVRVISPEQEAIRTALSEMIDHEVIAIFFDKDARLIRSLLMSLGAEPVTRVPLMPLTSRDEVPVCSILEVG